MDYENHWLQGDDGYREPTEPDFNELCKFIEENYHKYEWSVIEIFDVLDDYTKECHIKTEVNGYIFDAVGTYVSGELVKVEEVEVKLPNKK